MYFLVQEVRHLKLVLAGEKIPNFLKYAQKWACYLGSINKTCPWETWVQNEALKEMALYGEVPLSWCRKTVAARGSSWHRSGINDSGKEVPGL